MSEIVAAIFLVAILALHIGYGLVIGVQAVMEEMNS